MYWLLIVHIFSFWVVCARHSLFCLICFSGPSLVTLKFQCYMLMMCLLTRQFALEKIYQILASPHPIQEYWCKVCLYPKIKYPYYLPRRRKALFFSILHWVYRKVCDLLSLLILFLICCCPSAPQENNKLFVSNTRPLFCYTTSSSCQRTHSEYLSIR